MGYCEGKLSGRTDLDVPFSSTREAVRYDGEHTLEREMRREGASRSWLLILEVNLIKAPDVSSLIYRSSKNKDR